MKRPYHIQSDEKLFHKEYECEKAENINGDASESGVKRGIRELGEMPCPYCIDESELKRLIKEAYGV